MAKKTTESPQQLSFDCDDWLAPPAAPEPAPEPPSISPRFALAERVAVQHSRSSRRRRVCRRFAAVQLRCSTGDWQRKSTAPSTMARQGLHEIRSCLP